MSEDELRARVARLERIINRLAIGDGALDGYDVHTDIFGGRSEIVVCGSDGDGREFPTMLAALEWIDQQGRSDERHDG